jgi:hypothetical protein
LPIVIQVIGGEWDVDNIVSALEHNDRIRGIELWRIPSSQKEKVLAGIHQSIPSTDTSRAFVQRGNSADASLLNNLEIIFLRQLIFDTPQFAQFIGRTPMFKPKAHDETRLGFTDMDVSVALPLAQTTDGKTQVDDLMRTVGLAAFVSGAALQLVLSSVPRFRRVTTLRF